MSKKVGAIPEVTKANLIKAAVAEFHEHGFEKASLRRICANAGVTTGAMYFFFENKEDIFAEAVSPVMKKVLDALQVHIESENEGSFSDTQKELNADILISEEILNTYYSNKELVEIVLNNRERPVVIQFFDKIVALLDGQTRYLSNTTAEDGDAVFTECTVHWLSHLQLDMIMHVISHNYSKEQASQQVAIMVKFLRSGFASLLQE